VSLIRSMTGFGRAEASAQAPQISVETRSVNHRHLDVALRIPKALAALESDARKLVASRLERGRVDVAIQLGSATERAEQHLVVDAELAREHVNRARALGAELGVSGDVALTWVLERPGVVRMEEVEAPEPAMLWPALADALSRALDELVEQRATEGAALAGALRALLTDLEREVDIVAVRAPAAATRRESRLRDRLRALVGDLKVDETRILTEAAAWAEKTDVAEELARLRSHLDQFRSMLDKGGPVGRPLDFLIQELLREVNTVGSKADDLDVSQAVLAAKGVIEKMREQVQNLE
jgi:uncharacterized protein (TIGR00255 family)